MAYQWPGYTHLQLRVLMRLGEVGAATIAELAQDLSLSKQTVYSALAILCDRRGKAAGSRLKLAVRLEEWRGTQRVAVFYLTRDGAQYLADNVDMPDEEATP